ncbi:uncharacterized protein LOC131679700 [Topomyia yanbarensis]|uniref:uncharacterized protein LOC131679700 n=1 Tax=Topomyia yanbarensis TaxID=2498891 RepID=UPI00273CA416|nr:uncharacterized protein LOC131679700 [Topomyia yanbarensis]
MKAALQLKKPALLHRLRPRMYRTASMNLRRLPVQEARPPPGNPTMQKPKQQHSHSGPLATPPVVTGRARPAELWAKQKKLTPAPNQPAGQQPQQQPTPKAETLLSGFPAPEPVLPGLPQFQRHHTHPPPTDQQSRPKSLRGAENINTTNTPSPQ